MPTKMKRAAIFVTALILHCGLSDARDRRILDDLLPKISSIGNHENQVLPAVLNDPVHGVKMGISTNSCDNAVDNLDVDWDGSQMKYICYHPKSPFPVKKKIQAVEECDLPQNYFPKHVCMNDKIHYNVSIPTYGNHRPLWPIYGEYAYVPVQRWLHNLEHGAIVLLYHPCAEPLEVKRLKTLVRSCIRKHIITPYRSLPIDRPLALVSWGCKLMMNRVEKDIVTKFIKDHALQAPEGKLPKEGQYHYKLIQKAFIVPGSDYKDSNLCPMA